MAERGQEQVRDTLRTHVLLKGHGKAAGGKAAGAASHVESQKTFCSRAREIAPSQEWSVDY